MFGREKAIRNNSVCINKRIINALRLNVRGFIYVTKEDNFMIINNIYNKLEIIGYSFLL